MPRTYPIEKIRNIGIIAHMDASRAALQRLAPQTPLGFWRSLRSLFSYTGKLPFSRPLSRVNMRFAVFRI